MKTIKVLSIIGIVWFLISFIFLLSFIETDPEAANGWGILGLLYAIGYSITCLIFARKNREDFADKLLELNTLKEKNILTPEEFDRKKKDILGK